MYADVGSDLGVLWRQRWRPVRRPAPDLRRTPRLVSSRDDATSERRPVHRGRPMAHGHRERRRSADRGGRRSAVAMMRGRCRRCRWREQVGVALLARAANGDWRHRGTRADTGGVCVRRGGLRRRVHRGVAREVVLADGEAQGGGLPRRQEGRRCGSGGRCAALLSIVTRIRVSFVRSPLEKQRQQGIRNVFVVFHKHARVFRSTSMC